MDSITIGIPKGFYFYRYSLLWISFFKNLGLSVILSSNNDKDLYQMAISNYEKDLCLPAKLFLANIESMLDKADFLFLPRIEKLWHGLWTCPKIIAVNDIAKLYFSKRMKYISPTVSITQSHDTLDTLKKISIGIGNFLNIEHGKIIKAFRLAIHDQNEDFYKKTSKLPNNKASIEALLLDKKAKGSKLKIGIIGHPYVLNDNLLNKGIFQIIDEYDIDFLTPDNIPFNTLLQVFNEMRINSNTYWVSDYELLGTYKVFTDSCIDGIIFLNIFSCAIDSVIEEYIHFYNKKYKKPFIKFVIDEHTTLSSFYTKLFAFLDLILISKGKKSLINENRLSVS